MQGVDDKFIHYIENESWASIANLAIQFQVDIKSDNSEMKKLAKRVALAKYLLHAHLKECDKGNGFRHTEFFISIVKLLNSLEGEFSRNNVQQREFLLFLRLILHKMKKHKMFAHKPHLQQNEFRKMKDALENGKKFEGFTTESKMIENGHSV